MANKDLNYYWKWYAHAFSKYKLSRRALHKRQAEEYYKRYKVNGGKRKRLK